MSNGWNESADAWIAEQGADGDWGRRFVLDAPMLARVTGRGFARALDVGCGEGRFCRKMQAEGIATIGIDPAAALIEQARRLDPVGDYRMAHAESLDLPGASLDLAVCYLSLIDIAALAAAIAQIHRVLRAGGTLLIANLQGFLTANSPDGWTDEPDGSQRFSIDHYLDEEVRWAAWRGIRVQNWHRPLATYMQALLRAGFELRHFAEPEPVGGDPDRAARYRRAPFFLLMEWQKTTTVVDRAAGAPFHP
jgi:SAM-dependent methyltransferase